MSNSFICGSEKWGSGGKLMLFQKNKIFFINVGSHNTKELAATQSVCLSVIIYVLTINNNHSDSLLLLQFCIFISYPGNIGNK